MEKEIRKAFKASESMIKKAQKLKKDAIHRQDWSRIATMETYISGMEQILIVFKMAIGWKQD
jgi:hypothetical protein